MNKKICSLLFFVTAFLFGHGLYGQVLTQTIRGKVVDVDSKSPIFGANIILLNSDTLIGSPTDVDGKFRLEKVPVGRRSLKITSLGYEDAIMNNIIITSAKEVVLNIELREKIYTSEAVEIVMETDKTKANNDLVTVSARNFQAEETSRYAGSRGDPSRMVANYAGVASGSDARNDIIVRGNSPLGVLWRLEDIDIPNPNHFSAQGATGGPISMLNNNVLGRSDFLTGAFPAEYGNKTAAVFDLKFRNGNNEKREFTGQVGINGLEIGAEGPISKKQGSSYLINYRYSTLALFTALGINFGVSANPQYQDLSYKINIPTQKAGVFAVWGVGGISAIALLDSKQKKGDWSLVGHGEDVIYKTSMGATGLSNTYFFNKKISGKLSLSYSSSNFNVTVDTLSNIDESKFRISKNISTESYLTAKYTVTAKANARNLFKTGVTSRTVYFDAHSSDYYVQYQKFITSLNVNNSSATLFQSFLHWQFRATENLTLNTGAYYQVFFLNKSQAIEPRFGVQYQLSKKQNLSFGYGLHSQMQPVIYYFYDSYDPATDSYHKSNTNLGLTKAQHLVLSYDYNFAKNYRFKFETYYQSLYNVPVQQTVNSSFSMINVGTALEGIPLVDTLVNKGTGQNKGVEFTIEKFFSKHFYFLSTTSLYKSTYKGSDGVERSTSFNGGYVYNALAGYELEFGKDKNHTLSIDMRFTHAGGNRVTPIDLEKSKLAGQAVYDNSRAYSEKLKDYERVDFKIAYKLNRKHTSHSLFFTMENVLGRQNILQQVYNSASQSIQVDYQFGRFPYGGYRIEF